MDPTAVCEGKTASPMEIALEKENEEMLCLLAKFTEMPDLCKLFYLSKLMHKGRDNLGEKAKAREDFQKILSSLPVQLVSLHTLPFRCNSISSTQTFYSLTHLFQIRFNAILLLLHFFPLHLFSVASFSVASFAVLSLVVTSFATVSFAVTSFAIAYFVDKGRFYSEIWMFFCKIPKRP